MVLHITRTCLNNQETVFLKSVYIDEEYMRFFDLNYYELFHDVWEDEVRDKIGVEILEKASMYKDGRWYVYTIQLENTHHKIHIGLKDYKPNWILL